MNRIDLIVDRLENCKGLTQIDRMHLKKALAAARELKALKPVGWVTTEQFASTAHNVTRVTLHQDKNGIPLYALDEVKHDLHK